MPLHASHRGDKLDGMVPEPCYVFLLCPPYTGSTLLWKLLGTSPQVSTFETEGQFVPEVTEVMRQDPWNPDFHMPWPRIKQVWDRHWDPEKKFRVEKSPPNILRANAIEKHFQPCRFILLVRDPYAHTEGIMRRRQWDIRKSAEFARYCLRVQMQNAQNLTHALTLTYETMVQAPADTAQKLSAFLPGLGQLKVEAEFAIHSIDGVVTRPITDLNEKKIRALTSDQSRTITDILKQDLEPLHFWNYSLQE